jgi:hypothetical protein
VARVFFEPKILGVRWISLRFELRLVVQLPAWAWPKFVWWWVPSSKVLDAFQIFSYHLLRQRIFQVPLSCGWWYQSRAIGEFAFARDILRPSHPLLLFVKRVLFRGVWRAPPPAPPRRHRNLRIRSQGTPDTHSLMFFSRNKTRAFLGRMSWVFVGLSRVDTFASCQNSPCLCLRLGGDV